MVKSLFITPDRAAFSPPSEIFTYTVDDGTGKRSTATVSVFIRPDIVQAVAIDDVYRVAANSTGEMLYVMANDLAGASGVMELRAVTDPAGGSAEIDDNGTPGDATDDFIRYTPDGAFDNLDQFTYTIGNASGESTATVSVFESPDPGGQDVDIALRVEDIAGFTVTEIVEGDQFVLVATVQDQRPFEPYPGVFAAYLDVIYNREVALPNLDNDPNNHRGFDITYGLFDPDDLSKGGYLNGRSGSAELPGIIDEAGAFWSGTPEQPDLPLELFRITFTAYGVGEATFAADPANVLPYHHVVLYEPVTEVPPADIRYGFTSVQVMADTVTQGATDPYDVNADGVVAAIDALRVINRLNLAGPHSVYDRSTLRYDVNRDTHVTPLDALLIINRLNQASGAEGESSGRIRTAATAKSPLELPAAPTDALLESMESQTSDALVAPRDSNDSPDWRLLVGPAGSSASTAVNDLALDDTSWESLLENLAEDVLEAWLDPEED